MERRTAIFSIFMLLCLLPNSVYARTIEYALPRDTTPDIRVCFDLNAGQADKNGRENRKTLALLDSLFAHPAHGCHFRSIILVSPDPYKGKAGQDALPGQRRSEEMKKFLCRRYPQVNAGQIHICKGEGYGDALRKLVTADKEVPDREDVLALMEYHRDNPVRMQDFLQHLDAGIPYRYISNRLLPKLEQTEIRIHLARPEGNKEKTPAMTPEAGIAAGGFIPMDKATDRMPTVARALPQRKNALAATEKKKTIIKAEKKKETKGKRGKKPAAKAAGRDKAAGHTVLALKNNLLYDLALAPNIEMEIPIGKRWSVNAEYKSPWWSDSGKAVCYQLISVGMESRCRLGNRRSHRRLTGHFLGLYIEGGIYDFQFKGDGCQGKYYGTAGITYGYSVPVSRHLAFEFSLGIGYLTTEYQKYTPYEKSLVLTDSGKYDFIGPTKAKISLVWLITKKRERK